MIGRAEIIFNISMVMSSYLERGRMDIIVTIFLDKETEVH